MLRATRSFITSARIFNSIEYRIYAYGIERIEGISVEMISLIEKRDYIYMGD